MILGHIGTQAHIIDVCLHLVACEKQVVAQGG